MNVADLFEGLLNLAEKNPVLLVTLLLGVGSLIGAFRVKRVGLGPAAVLFLAIALSAANPALALPTIVGNVGLALFAYTVGVNAGPSFFASLRRGSHLIIATVVLLVFAGGVAVGLGAAFNLPKSVMAGVFAGSLTNTPALASATEQIPGEGPIVGYSLTYVFGVLGMLAIATIAAGKPENAVTDERHLFARNVRIDVEGLPDLQTLTERYGTQVVFSRIMRGDTPEHEGVVSIATDSVKPVRGDILTVVGALDQVEKVIQDLGHPSTVNLHMDRRYLDFRRVTLSNHQLSGKTIESLKLERTYGATVTRVRRGDVDLLASDDLTLLAGDRLRVVASPEALVSVAAYLGDSENSNTHLNAASLGIGMSLGILLGLLSWPLPADARFSLGVAGGCLIVGLFLGRTMKTGPFVWTLPHGTSNTLGGLGLLLFLAYAGSNAGAAIVEAFKSNEFPYIILAGIIVTSFFFGSLLLFGRYLNHTDNASLAGTIAGAGTQPAVLAHANSLLSNPKVNLGYALVYPAAMITKVIIAPLIGTLL